MFSLVNGSEPVLMVIDDPNNTRVTFRNLSKGTEYWARVAGINVRGIGEYSHFVNNQTNVDRKLVFCW